MKESLRSLLQKIAFAAIVAACWEILARAHVFGPRSELIFPTLEAIGAAFVQNFVNGYAGVSLWVYLTNSLRLLLLGMVIGIGLAFLFSGLSMVSKVFHNLYSFVVAIADLLPGVALLPVVIVICGVKPGVIVFLVVHSVIWPMSRNLIDGFRSVPRIYVEAGMNLNGDAAFAPCYDGRAQWSASGSSVVGFTSYTSVFQKLLYGMEAHMIDKDDDDKMVFAADNEHFIDCATKLTEIFSVPGQYLNANDDDGFSYNLNIFPSARAFFLGGELKDAQVFREMEDEFGVLPLPKYDESQSRYFTTLDFQMMTFAIPYTQSAPEDAALLLDAMSFETNEKILDVFLGNRIEQKGLRNEDSIEMLHIVYDGLGIDLGEAFDLFGTLSSTIKDNIPQGISDFASLIERNKKPIVKQMNKLQEKFE